MGNRVGGTRFGDRMRAASDQFAIVVEKTKAGLPVPMVSELTFAQRKEAEELARGKIGVADLRESGGLFKIK